MIALIGFAWNENDWTGGMFISLMDPEGKFEADAYNKGMGYKMLISNHSSTDFTTLKTAVVKDTVVVDSTYFDRAGNKVIAAKTIFPTVKPKMTPKKVPLPADCGKWDYQGVMMDGLALDIKQYSCLSMSFRWHYVAWPPQPGWDDYYTITPDGSCHTSKMFGEACYYFENGDLVRESISSSTWEPMKYYMKIVNAGGYLCGISTGETEPRLFSSTYPSSDPNFTKNCTWY